MEDEPIFCSNCEAQIVSDDEYCSHCGLILLEEKKCYLHKEDEAQGTCLICLKLCCNKCGLFVNRVYLCNEHSSYEIIEGMARVYGSSDNLEIEYYNDILEKEELHPFIYSRKRNPFSFGKFEYSLFEASGEYDGHLINEIKLMMPLKEVLEAEKILEPLINDLS